ncbi:MAG: TIGR03013 family PEP-CTERM/XrtA system glycosyltransferase [Gammaproteobacteria bacterium]|nr:TIGR03013 family PEP-CTERM/XrtA system glycosyltransferase [Gammaproteobacteria bacterium]
MLRIFNHYITTSFVWLVLIETLILFFSVYLAREIRFFGEDPELKLLLEPFLIKAFVYTVIMGLSMTAVGLHTRSVVENFAALLTRTFLAFFLGFLASTLIFYIYPSLFLGRGVFAITLAVSFFGIAICRIIFDRIDDGTLFKKKIVVLGTGKQAEIINQLKSEAIKRGQEIIGYVSIDQNPPLINKSEILHIKNSLLELVQDYDIDEIVLAMDDRRQGFPISGLLECKMKGVMVHDIIHFLERVTGHIELEALRPSVMIFSSGFSNAVAPNGAKRVFDILVSLLILIIASPVIVFTATAIWLSSFGRDPIFYRQVRIGLCNAPFKVLKFRSMKTDAEKNGAQFAQKNDSRVTFIGAFIRKTRIDELPQLFNVLKGEMSFVGPRPERPEFVLGFEQTIPHYELRHTVKPGITGWAQICYPYGETAGDTKNKLQYDLYYIKNYSLFLDLTIIFQTIQVVLFGQGAR